MNIEARVNHLERQMRAVTKVITDTGSDFIKLGVDKHDFATLQSQIDSLSMQINVLQGQLQAIGESAK